jgi:hypothetical protein
MIRAEMRSRSIGGGRLVIDVLGTLVLFGMLAPGGPACRALAFQESGERRSVLGTGSSGERAKAEPSRAATSAKPARPASAAEKAKLTPQEARELMQAFRQLQAAVEADHRAGAGAVEVKVKRPARMVSPPTLTSAELDRLVERHLAKNDPKVEPAPITTDVEFVRRVYFDLIGKPPTPEQFLAFVRDRSHDKRGRLLDHLLNSPDWARNWARYWRDVIKFHATNENLARVRFDELEDWLAGQLQANEPWDEIARSMITATGRNDENGAVAFPLAYEAQPVEMAGEVSRIFLGVQIQCAQCHDHKTDSWKRRQFHEFAAFFAGARPRQVQPGGQGQPPVFAVVTQPRARYTMPDKENPAKQIPVSPRFFLTAAGAKESDPALPDSLGAEKRRELVASYITGQDNPWFARAFVNRTWYALMGEAFYEPIDDMGPERTPRALEVLEPLADQWQRGGYDIRWLYRTILNTQAYQRRVRSTANAAGKTPFASGCPSRLRADQVFEALAQGLGLPLDGDGNVVLPAPNNRGPRPGAQAKAAPATPGDPARLASKDKEPSQPAKKGAVKKAVEAAGLPLPAKKAGAVLRRGGPRLLFDRLFGVDPSIPNDDVLGTIPQALFMMNSPLVNNRIAARPGTVLGEILATAPDERSALNALYLRVLSRQPTPKEVEICGRYLAAVGDHREAFEDIYWSLINSTEFLTRR